MIKYNLTTLFTESSQAKKMLVYFFCCKGGSAKSAHEWISIIYCMLDTYVITTTKMKSFYSPNAVRPQGGTLMYTFLVLIYDLLNISLKSLTLLTSTFFEWNMKEDSPGYN